MSTGYQPWRRYDEDFKRDTVDLLMASGRTVAEIAGELGIPYRTLEKWKAQMRGNNRKPPSDRPADQLKHENEQLRRRLARAELERDILKKALAICSSEANSKDVSS